MTARPLDLPDNAPPTPSGAFVPLPSIPFVADSGRRVSTLLARPGEPVFLATDKSLYARRITAAVNERRPWLRVDLSRVNDADVPSGEQLVETLGLGWTAVVSPQLMIDMLAGVLTGSLERGKVGADGSRSFRFNVSVDKANRELRLDEDLRDERSNVLRSLAITGDVFPGTAELRGDGTLSRLRIAFRQKPEKQTTLELAIDMRIDKESPADVSVLRIPVKKSTIRVSTVPALTAALSQRLAVAFTAPQLTTPGPAPLPVEP